MQRVLQRHPMMLAVAAALAVMARPVDAQVFDPNSAAVRQTYLGAATQEKKDAALAGLGLLAKQVGQSVTSRSTDYLRRQTGVTENSTGSDFLISSTIDNSVFPTSPLFAPSVSIIQAASLVFHGQ